MLGREKRRGPRVPGLSLGGPAAGDSPAGRELGGAAWTQPAFEAHKLLITGSPLLLTRKAQQGQPGGRGGGSHWGGVNWCTACGPSWGGHRPEQPLGWPAAGAGREIFVCNTVSWHERWADLQSWPVLAELQPIKDLNQALGTPGPILPRLLFALRASPSYQSGRRDQGGGCSRELHKGLSSVEFES